MDFLSSTTRSHVMSRIRSTETRPERMLRSELSKLGLRGYRKNYRAVPRVSSADVAFTRRRVAVFVDGSFWHGHPKYFTPGKSGRYWDEKIERNMRRDRITTRAYRRDGWTVIRVWDFVVERDPGRVARRVAEALAERYDSSS